MSKRKRVPEDSLMFKDSRNNKRNLPTGLKLLPFFRNKGYVCDFKILDKDTVVFRFESGFHKNLALKDWERKIRGDR